MRIVLTTHQFLPDFSSGTEILTYEVAKELRNQGHDVSVFTGFPSNESLKDEERFDSYLFSGFNIERFYHNNKPMGDQSNIYEIEYNNHLVGSYFKDYLKREKPDIVHFFHLMRLSASIIDACYELGIPTVLTPTDFWLICPTCQLRLLDNRPCLGPDKFSVNCVRHIMGLNQSAKKKVLSRKVPYWLFDALIILIKKGSRFDRYYTPVIGAFVDRQEFLLKRMNRLNKVAIPTKNMLDRLTQNGLELQRTISIPFGLNLAPFKNKIFRKHDPSNPLRLGYIGTIYEHKGVHVLVEAVRKLAGEPIELNIYGKLDDYPDYVNGLKIIAQNDQRIKFCGTFPNHEIGNIFSILDVLVVPSLWYENSPLVIISAQAAGCPVIASNMPGMSEVIEHRRNGLLFEAGDTLQLAAAIRTLLNNRELLQELSNNAKKPLSIQGYTDKLLVIYNELIQGRTTV